MAARSRPAAHIADFVAPAASATVSRPGRLQAGSKRSPMNAPRVSTARVNAARALPPAKTQAGRKAVPIMEKTAPVKRSTPRPLPSKMQPSLLETVAARTTKAVPGKPAKTKPVAKAPSVQNAASRKATPKTSTRTRPKAAAQSTLFDVPAAAKPVVRASGNAKKAAVKPTPVGSVSAKSTGGKTTDSKVVPLKTTTAPVASRKKPITTKIITAKTVTKPASAQTEKATSKGSTAKPAKTKTIAVRKKGRGTKAAGSVSAVPIAADPTLKRVRSRPNLSEQYAGNTVHKERAGSESAASKRARRDAAARERLKQLMNPDDELIRRLAQAGAISPLLIDGEEEPAPRRKKNSGATRRPRKWDLHCGKCGAKSTLQTPAGLCFKCGTIVVRFD